MKKKKEENRYAEYRQAGLLTTIPILLAVSPIVGFFIGQFLDKKLHTEPYLAIVFLILGFVAGARQTARIIKIANRSPNDKDDHKKE